MQIDRINGLVGNQGMKTPVLCIATGAILLSGEQTIDGVVCLQPSSTNSNRVLVTGQADATTNGIYLCQASAWTREPDWDGSLDVRNGTLIPVATGTQYAGTLWRVTTADIIAVGTSNITFSQVFTSTATPILNAPNKNPPIGADKISIVDSVTGLLALLTFTNLVTYLSGLCSAGWNAFTSSSCSGNSASATAATLAATASALANTASVKIPTIGTSVTSNALTMAVSPQYLDFRSPTVSFGTVTTLNAAPAQLVVPSTATLGTISAQLSRLIVLEILNAGVAELAVVNQAGGNNLDETTVISTTAIAAGSNSANVIYSTTARANVPFRVMGYIESTQAVAGTWATVPSTVQGAGGQALAAMGSFGFGQTWQSLTGSRALSTTYYNTTGKPIMLALTGHNATAGSVFSLTVNGIPLQFAVNDVAGSYGTGNLVIPVDASYVLAGNGTPTVDNWYELR